jgi:hypothetical protein
MCIPIQKLGNRARRIQAFANLFLATGIALIHFIHPSSHQGQMFTDGFGGLLLGLSIGFSLFCLIKARRCRLSRE